MYHKKTWSTAATTTRQTVTQRSHLVETEPGTIFRGNRHHLQTQNVSGDTVKPEPETEAFTPDSQKNTDGIPASSGSTAESPVQT